ncbi:MAG: hypothetical protein J6I64_05880, partial [Lachnospiraceae bacterium]|nr:hypothetical protein [Lachnospiraceae bacterium]
TLVVVFVAGIFVAGRTLKKTMELTYKANATNQGLYNALFIIGLGLMLLIPQKTIVWGLAAAMLFLLIMVLKQFRDGLDDDGIVLSGHRTGYDQWENYSMRRVDKAVEFRLYRPGKIRLMVFSQKQSQQVERLLASRGLKKQEFQAAAMNGTAKNG